MFVYVIAKFIDGVLNYHDGWEFQPCRACAYERTFQDAYAAYAVIGDKDANVISSRPFVQKIKSA